MARPDWLKGRVVQDATEPVSMNIRQKHIDNASPLNGMDCVAGRCALQSLDAAVVWFYRSKAYVAWDDDSPVLRYSLSSRLINKVIVILDDPQVPNSDIVPGVYTMLPPPPAQRLGVNRTKKDGAPSRTRRTDRGHRVTGRITAARNLPASA